MTGNVAGSGCPCPRRGGRGKSDETRQRKDDKDRNKCFPVRRGRVASLMEGTNRDHVPDDWAIATGKKSELCCGEPKKAEAVRAHATSTTKAVAGGTAVVRRVEYRRRRCRVWECLCSRREGPPVPTATVVDAMAAAGHGEEPPKERPPMPQGQSPPEGADSETESGPIFEGAGGGFTNPIIAWE